jgi:hypothetical protein
MTTPKQPAPVVLWHRAYPPHERPWSDHKCEHVGVEYRALPVADFDALTAKVAALEAERDAMRQALGGVVNAFRFDCETDAPTRRMTAAIETARAALAEREG